MLSRCCVAASIVTTHITSDGNIINGYPPLEQPHPTHKTCFMIWQSDISISICIDLWKDGCQMDGTYFFLSEKYGHNGFKIVLKSVHFKKPVARSSFLSKSVVIFVVVILKVTTLFKRNEDRVTDFLKWTDFSWNQCHAWSGYYATGCFAAFWVYLCWFVVQL